MKNLIVKRSITIRIDDVIRHYLYVERIENCIRFILFVGKICLICNVGAISVENCENASSESVVVVLMQLR